MVTLTPAELGNAVRCFEATIPSSNQLSMTLYLLMRILKGIDPMANVDPKALAEASKWWAQCLSEGQQLAMANYLLYQILSLGGGTGISLQVFDGNGPPVGLQPGQNPAMAGTYYDLLTGVTYQWNTSTMQWPPAPPDT